MEAWGRSLKSYEMWFASGELDHKRMQHLCDACLQRAWSCSRYVVQPSRPVVGKFFNFSAHSIPKDALYSPCSILNAWRTCPWKCRGGQADGGVAGGGGVVWSKIQ